MKKLLFFAIAFNILYSSAQNNAYNKQFAIGINFSPDYCYRKLKYSGSDSTLLSIVNNSNNTEVAKFGFTTGVNFSYFFKQNFALGIALLYSNKGYKTEFIPVNFGSSINTGTGISSDPNDPIAVQFSYNYNYMDIPVSVSYSIGKNSLSLITSTGVVTGIFINGKTVSYKQFQDDRVEKEGQSGAKKNFNYNKVSLTGLICIGFGIKLGKQLNLKVLPAYRFGMLPVRNNTEIKEYLWNMGLNTELNYKF